jgi:hypothetical protein
MEAMGLRRIRHRAIPCLNGLKAPLSSASLLSNPLSLLCHLCPGVTRPHYMAHRLLEIQKERKISGHQGLFSEKRKGC